MLLSASLPLAFSPGLGLKRPYEDGAMDDKDLIKKMKRNLRKGTRSKEGRKEQWVLLPDCFFLLLKMERKKFLI